MRCQMDFSDHDSFWKKDCPTIMLTDTAFYRNPQYHPDTDRPDTLDYGAMAELVKGIAGALGALDRSSSAKQ